MSELGQDETNGCLNKTSALVGKQTIVFSGGEIVPGYEPKFWRFEITSAVTSTNETAYAVICGDGRHNLSSNGGALS